MSANDTAPTPEVFFHTMRNFFNGASAEATPAEVKPPALSSAQPTAREIELEQQLATEREETAKLLAAGRKELAATAAAKFADNYLENGGKDNEGQPILSDRAKFTAAFTSLHVKAQAGEKVTAAELETLCSIPVKGSVIKTAALDAAELEAQGARAYAHDAGPADGDFSREEEAAKKFAASRNGTAPK